MKKLFKWLLFLSILLALSITTLVYNPGLVRTPLENYLAELSGYPISLEGSLEINVGKLIRITATDISISSPGRARQQELLNVGYFSLVLVSGSLLEDILLIDSIKIDDLQLELETYEDGSGNWENTDAQAPKVDSDDSEVRVIFNTVQLNNATFRYLDGKKGFEHRLQITSLDQKQLPDGMLNIRLDGDYNDKQIAFDGQIGPYANLVDRSNISFIGDGTVGSLRIVGNGKIDDLLNPRRPRFNLEIDGPDIDAITRTIGIDDLGSGEFFLRARGSEINDHYEASIDGDIGDISLNVSARVSDLLQLDEVDLRMAFHGPSLGSFTRAFGIEDWPDKPFRLQAEVNRLGSTLNIPNLRLNIGGSELLLDALLSDFPRLDFSRVKLSITGDDVAQFRELIGTSGVASGPFDIRGSLDVSADGLELLKLEVNTSVGHVSLSGNLGAAPGYSGSKLHLRVDGDNANLVMSVFGVDALPEQPFNLDARIETVENGLLVENGVLVIKEDERLELGGFFALIPGMYGTDLEVKLTGNNLNRILKSVVGDNNVPDEAYELSGRIQVLEDGIQLDDFRAGLEQLKLAVTGMISNQPGWAGTDVRVSIEGPDLHTLLPEWDESELPLGAFRSSGWVKLSEDTLSINDLVFETDTTHAKVDLVLGWPIGGETDIHFDVNMGGDDIRHLIPRTDWFEPDLASYEIYALGQKQGALISLQKFDATMGDLRVKLNGKVDDNPNDQLVNISFSVNSNDVSTLGSLNGDRLPPLALELKGEFRGTAQRFVLDHINGKIGDSDIAGSLDVSLAGSRPKIDLALKSDYIDIRHFWEFAVSDDGMAGSKLKDRLIPPTPLPLDAIAAADIELDIEIAKLRHKVGQVRSIRLAATTQSGYLEVPVLLLAGPRGKLEASFSIHPIGTRRADVKFDLNADQLNLNLSGQPEDRLSQVPTTDIDLHVSGTGSNLQEVAGSLNGSFYIGSRGGILEGVNLSVLDTFILDDFFNLISPKTKKNSNDLTLECAATIFKITDGRLETDPALAFTTNRITVVSKGSLDLKTEEIRFNFNATPNNALKLSAGELFNPYILVGGTLSKPDVGLDPGKVLFYGGAAIGTAGISILAKGLIDRVSTVIPVCEDMLKKGLSSR